MSEHCTHTPEPWHYVAPRSAIDRPSVARADGYTVAETMIAGEADTRLIAALPELLAAAEAALTDLDELTSDAFAVGEDHVSREALRAAIRRARGEE